MEMTHRHGLLATAVAALVLVAGPVSTRTPSTPDRPRSHVVVTLTAPAGNRAAVDAAQTRFVHSLDAAVPQAQVHWRYRLVLDGVSVVLPTADLGRLSRLPGVERVYAPATYRSLGGPAGGTIGARTLPGLGLADAGAGMKIGVIDDGIDQRHPFFDPAGYAMPPGYPKGQTAYTTAKVIVARAFPPPGTSYPAAGKPFDPEESGHATHVAGIAAGNAGTLALGARISGVAPRAYLGNYKALTVPTDAGVGLDGNAPELVAAIEAAVADGMDVINLSLGEPEIEPTNDVVARALDAAADLGVVPVVAAGNDFDGFGYGSVSSPGSSEKAITVAASTDAPIPLIASFSAGGPTPVSLRLKPDVTAPGLSIVSSVPNGWSTLSGTSMASPHVAGAAALLLQRHPDWTPALVKGALMGSARPTADDGGRGRPSRAGAGLVDVTAADDPVVVASPGSLSFGLLRGGTTVERGVELVDVGTGAGTWTVSVENLTPAAKATVTAPPTVTVPGPLSVSVAAAAGAPDADLEGAILLTRDTVVRRIPFWAHLSAPALGRHTRTPLAKPGLYASTTKGRPSLVVRYRYPDVVGGGDVTARLAGPERVYRFQLRRAVANFGVVVTDRDRGVTVEPRIVSAGDENRLTGYAALPLNLNPYLADFLARTQSAGAISPAPGRYDIVFDSATRAGAGRFAFRFWVDDVTPPTVKLLTKTVAMGTPVGVHVTDLGSGVDVSTVDARFGGGSPRQVSLVGDVLRISTDGLRPGTVKLRLQVSDYQETHNMENVARILPNTRVVTATVTIRPRSG